jgi:hypothetical protein
MSERCQSTLYICGPNTTLQCVWKKNHVEADHVFMDDEGDEEYAVPLSDLELFLRPMWFPMMPKGEE